MPVGVKLDYVQLLECRMVQQYTSFEKTEAVLETRRAVSKARPDAALTEMTAHRDHLRDEVDRL